MQAIELLRELEWSGQYHGDDSCCPVCGQDEGGDYDFPFWVSTPPQVHRADCQLAAIIGAPRLSRAYEMAVKVAQLLSRLEWFWKYGVGGTTSQDRHRREMHTKGILAFIQTNVRPA